MKLISACLVGCRCRYDGQSKAIKEFEDMVKRGEAVFVCPEQLGGLPTPRPASQIVGGTGDDVLDGEAKVVTSSGMNVTEEYLRGARETLRVAKVVKAEEAILKERSPSCGSTAIYDGTFTEQKIPGVGVTAALLRRHGIKVYSEENYL